MVQPAMAVQGQRTNSVVSQPAGQQEAQVPGSLESQLAPQQLKQFMPYSVFDFASVVAQYKADKDGDLSISAKEAYQAYKARPQSNFGKAMYDVWLTLSSPNKKHILDADGDGKFGYAATFNSDIFQASRRAGNPFLFETIDMRS